MIKKPQDFDKVIIADSLKASLLGQASKEGLIGKGSDKNLEKSFRRSRYKQEALSLLILFDKILLPDFETDFHIPSLEEDDIVNVISMKYKDISDPLARLERTVPTRPFVLNKLMSKRDDKFWRFMSNILQVSRRNLYNGALDYFLAYYRNDDVAMRENLLSQILTDFPIMINESLDKFVVGKFDEDHIDTFIFLYLQATFTAAHVEMYQAISEEYKSGVATYDFTGVAAGWTSTNNYMREPARLANSFLMLRCALDEEGLFFPRIESIEHALRLRKDPNLRAFREQLLLFHSYFAKGDIEAATKLRREVSKAKAALLRVKQWETGLKFVTYFSLPASIVESLMFGVPIAGTSLSIFSAAATATISKVKNKNEWVLFGR
jgi:hypothetical protein